MRSDGPVEVWRGGVQAWECDEMGHMNVRFHLARAMQGLAGAAAALGMPNAFSPNATSSLMVRGHHVRFLREARVGVPLHMTAGVLAMGEHDAVLLQTLVHSRSGETAATFVTRVVHVTAQEGRSFPWPRRARDAMEHLLVRPSTDAGTRSVSAEEPAATDIGQAVAFAAMARGVVTSADCDGFGRMRTELALAWIVEGLPHLVEPVRLAAQETIGPDGRIGGAALEYRLTYFGAPRCGDLLEVRSGLVALDSKIVRMRHWLIDPRTGAPWAAAENVSVNFDLDTRKAIAMSPEAVRRLQPQMVGSQS